VSQAGLGSVQGCKNWIGGQTIGSMGVKALNVKSGNNLKTLTPQKSCNCKSYQNVGKKLYYLRLKILDCSLERVIADGLLHQNKVQVAE
jgi:hypothetical protein